MKIALAGASSTGKTTLLMELLKQDFAQYLNLTYVTTDARSILKTKFEKQNIDLLTESEFKKFQRIYFENKIAEEDAHQNFITDRSFADAFVYLSQRVQQTLALEKQYKDANDRYDFVVYLPFGAIPFENDGHRSTNMAQHQTFAAVLENTLSKWGISVLRITEFDVELRVEQVLKFIKEHFG